MPKTPPIVYLLHGEDQFSISQLIHKLEEKIGDPSSAEMNTIRLDGNNLSMQALEAAAGAMPFLASRRLVIVNNVTRKLSKKTQQEKFIGLIERLPSTTALVLVEQSTLGEKHWLLTWAQSAGDRALIQKFSAPQGGQLAARLRKYADEIGGEITPQAASYLSELAGENLLAATQEVNKLLTYVNFQRPVDVEDVEKLAAFASVQGDFFALIDAIGRGDSRKAMDMLRSLLEEEDPLRLFFNLVSNFRLLLLTREILDAGGSDAIVADKLDIHPYRAKKLSGHARKLTLSSLESIFKHLFEYDLQIKTGDIKADLALDLLVASLTSQPG